MDNILQLIVHRLRPALAAEKLRFPLKRLANFCEELPPNDRDFGAALKKHGQISIIAELKKCSPSKGIIRHELNVPEVAVEMERGGAAAISVLTEPNFFMGCRDNLMAATNSVSIPILRKDFIFDPYQIYQSRLWGASAVLLIAALLKQDEFQLLFNLSQNLGLNVLAEVHNREELDMVVECGAGIIGVNARNLNNFEVQLNTACQLISLLPDNVVKVAESAILCRADLEQVHDSGADACLIGEALMRADSPSAKLRELYGY